MKTKIVFFITDKNILILEEYINSIKERGNSLYEDIFFDICIFNFNLDCEKINTYIESNDNSNTYYIITIIEYDFFINKIKHNINIYILNTEQLTRQDMCENIINFSNSKIILDYSACNILYTKKNHFYLPYQINNSEIFNYEKIYDIVTICSVKRKFIRRDSIFNSIRIQSKRKNKFPNMVYIVLKYGKERDDILFKSKILLNIHAKDNYKIFEEMRCTRCILNKIIVISEESENIQDYYFKDNIILCKYDDLVKTTMEVFNNYDYYYNKLFGNFDIRKAQLYHENKLKETVSKICNKNH